MKKTQNNGFTLIELLVVVAVIGILSTIVIASLSVARNKAKDVAVVAASSSFRTQAELLYPTGNYTGLCTNQAFLNLMDSVQSQGGSLSECEANAQAYRFVFSLPSESALLMTSTAYAAGEDAVCTNSIGKVVKIQANTLQNLSFPSCEFSDPYGTRQTDPYGARW